MSRASSHPGDLSDAAQSGGETALRRDRLRGLFLDWERAKQCARLLDALTTGGADATDEQRAALMQWRQTAVALRGRLITAGLPLAEWAVGRYPCPTLERDECRGMTQAALVRAVDTFDVRYGTAFSTYAAACMRRALYVEASRVRRRRRREREAGLRLLRTRGDVHEPSREQRARSLAEEAARIVRDNRAGLSERERSVLLLRFGLRGAPTEVRATLAETGTRLGMTRDAVRRLEQVALAKVRVVLVA